ncbi:MAG: D-alanine--D-alanine ligase family protein [Mycobacteriales bacterium]
MSRYVWVLTGGLSYEREVSLRSGHRISDALRQHGYEAELHDADGQLLAGLTADSPDAVVIALHGSTGEDGGLRALLEMVGVPYVGSNPEASALAWDKPRAKAWLSHLGIRTPRGVSLSQHAFRELGAAPVLDHVVKSLDLPLMIKPAQGGSGLGAAAVKTRAELPAAMVACFSYGDTALVEQFIEGSDIAVSVVELDETARALEIVEIVPKDGVYDYTARYTAGHTTWHTPARLDKRVAARVAELAVQTHQALGLRDLSRIDLIVDLSGEPWVLEANVAPGTTPTSLLPLAAEASGVTLGELFAQLIEQAIARQAAS